MEIRYKDFAQQTTKGDGNFSGYTGYNYSKLDEALTAISSWIREEHINVLNIETLVLPTSIKDGTIQTNNSPMRVSGENSSSWYQVYRVWFKVTI